MAAIFSWFPLMLRRRRRESVLAEAAGWPVVTARLLKATVVEKDPLCEGGTAFQESQVECGFYFTLDGSYYGGHLRSGAMSDSEAHRAVKALVEDAELRVRYAAGDPDRAVVLPEDNAGFAVGLWGYVV